MVKSRTLRTAALRLAIVPLVAAALHAIGSGPGAVGDPFAAAKSQAGFTQVVELNQAGDLLAGKPAFGHVAGLLLLSPGIGRGRIVLRERQVGDSGVLVQVSAPSGLLRGLTHVRLLIGSGQHEVRLYQAHHGAWFKRPLQPLTQPEPGFPSPSQAGWVAGDLENLELLYLLWDLPGMDTSPRNMPPLEFGAFDRQVRYYRAVSNLAWPAVFLAGLIMLSRRAHSRGAGPKH
jgi:hypothetical protein